MSRFLFLSLFLSIGNFAWGQTPKEDSIKVEILKLSAEWNRALVTRDSLTLGRILSSDFTLSSANGSLVAKKEWMRNTLHGLLTDSAQFLGAQKITVYGYEAISEGVLHWTVKNTDKSGRTIVRNNEYLVADIWRLNDGRWQVAHRISKLARKR